MLSIILLPGLACDAALFGDQIPALAARHRVQVSGVHTQGSTLPAMAAALLAARPGRHVLVGSSMGGMLALEVHRQAPARVQGIALLGTTARADTPAMVALRRQACEHFAAGRMEEVLRANVLFAFHPHGARNATLVAGYLAMIRRAGADQLIQQNRAVMARADRRAHLRHVTCPALVACGEADRLTPAEHARELAAGIPAARLEIVPGAGHLLTLEQPARVNALLLGWLEQLGA
jgi:pimeloyl-ACP methyl ester carboxylesterase